MKSILICGYFAKNNEIEVKSAARKPVEYSSNNYIRNLITGFQVSGDDYIVLSAPLIGSYPNASSVFYFKGFTNEQQECQYVNFLNLWGVRNYSRASSLKRAIKKILDDNPEETFRIIVCSVHTPFLECAAYAKKLRSDIKICLIVPDLPQYMHLDSKPSFVYQFAKKVDIKRFNRFNLCVDAYVLLTEHMKEKIALRGKPYTVAEGIASRDIVPVEHTQTQGENYTIVYTGKTYEKFGIKKLVRAFMNLSCDKYRLIICGAGDCDDYILEQTRIDSRILHMGQVPPDVAREMIANAKVLVNPRQNNDIYTRYSFPSKNLEYLSTGHPVVYYLLDGMKPEYATFAFVPNDDSIEALGIAIEKAITVSATVQMEKYLCYKKYIQGLYAEEIYRKVKAMLN